MKIKEMVRFPRPASGSKPATLALFGAARLVKKPDGRHELIGGTAGDRTAALEWCSLFAPEVVFTSVKMTARTNPLWRHPCPAFAGSALKNPARG